MPLIPHLCDPWRVCFALYQHCQCFPVGRIPVPVQRFQNLCLVGRGKLKPCHVVVLCFSLFDCCEVKLSLTQQEGVHCAEGGGEDGSARARGWGGGGGGQVGTPSQWYSGVGRILHCKSSEGGGGMHAITTQPRNQLAPPTSSISKLAVNKPRRTMQAQPPRTDQNAALKPASPNTMQAPHPQHAFSTKPCVAHTPRRKQPLSCQQRPTAMTAYCLGQ